MMSDEQQQSPSTHPGDGPRWRHRRAMAYAAMTGLLVFGARFVFWGPIAAANESVIGITLWGCISVVGAYMGFAVADDVFRAKKP